MSGHATDGQIDRQTALILECLLPYGSGGTTMDTVRRLVQGQHTYFENAESILCIERNVEPEFV